MFSNANAEKVVNPPQKPVAISKERVEPGALLFSVYPIINPMIKHPMILMVNVPSGNLLSDVDWMKVPIQYLNTPPAALPMTTNKEFFTLIMDG